jgi:predicted nucleotidyltransferase
MINLRSRVQKKILGYYFTNPDVSLHLRDLAKIIGEDPGQLSREIVRLERDGLFISEIQGRQKYIRLNRAHFLYDELEGIILKTAGVVGQLRNILSTIPTISRAYVYGSFAKSEFDARSDVDLLLVGSPSQEVLEEEVKKLEKGFKREINYVLMSDEEFNSRKGDNDPFLLEVLNNKNIDLFGNG